MGAEGVLRTAPNCRVAIKKEAKKSIFDQETMQRTRDQANILRKLAHEHIVPVVDEYEDDSAFFLIMPLASAGSLFSAVRNKTLTEFETRNFTSQAISGLAHVHKLGFVHTDVKPHNFLLNLIGGRFHVWLCDFGLANPLRPDGRVGFAEVRGTFGYCAPEMIKRQDYGPPVDMFALGVTVHNLLLGYFPFDPPSNFEELDFEPRYWKHLSDASRAILVGMLDLEPATRLTAASAVDHEWFSADVREEQKVEKYVTPPDASNSMRPAPFLRYQAWRHSWARAKTIDRRGQAIWAMYPPAQRSQARRRGQAIWEMYPPAQRSQARRRLPYLFALERAIRGELSRRRCILKPSGVPRNSALPLDAERPINSALPLEEGVQSDRKRSEQLYVDFEIIKLSF